jgi:hypothetical protein
VVIDMGAKISLCTTRNKIYSTNVQNNPPNGKTTGCRFRINPNQKVSNNDKLNDGLSR